MRVIEIKEFGAPEMLVPNTRPDPAVPTAGSGEVLIKVLAAGINRPDVLQRKGHYPVPAGASDIPGLEVAGEIVGGDLAHADNALGLQIGDKVCALVQGGGYADLCTAPVAQCLPYPKGFSDLEAAALPETFYTVWSNVFMRGQLSEGETLLVQGGSSGIGVTAILIAKALGHKVFVTAGLLGSWAGATGAAGAAAGATVPDKTPGLTSFLLPTQVIPRVQMKKIAAKMAVVWDRKLAEPLAPNKLPEAPEPKAAPISAPLPC